MKELIGIKKYLDEIIKGNNENLEEFKEELKSFFHGKTQNDFNKIEKTKLQQLVRILEIVDNNRELNEIDRALLDNAFNKKPLRYCWSNIEYKLDSAKLKLFRNFLIKKIDFGNSKNDFVKWIDWIMDEGIEWDDGEYENKDKNFMVRINITNYDSKIPDLKIFMIGDKKYKEIMKKSVEFVKLPVLEN